MTDTFKGLPVLDLSLLYITRSGLKVRNLWFEQTINTAPGGFNVHPNMIVGERQARYGNGWHKLAWYPNSCYSCHRAPRGNDMVVDEKEIARIAFDRIKRKILLCNYMVYTPLVGETIFVNRLTTAEEQAQRTYDSWYENHKSLADFYATISQKLMETESKKMLDLSKKYQTRDGRAVVGLQKENAFIYGHVDGTRHSWFESGRHSTLKETPLDLVLAESATIDINKKYTNIHGKEVEIFAIKDGRVWGRVKSFGNPNLWCSDSWPIDTKALKEVRPVTGVDLVVGKLYRSDLNSANGMRFRCGAHPEYAGWVRMYNTKKPSTFSDYPASKFENNATYLHEVEEYCQQYWLTHYPDGASYSHVCRPTEEFLNARGRYDGLIAITGPHEVKFAKGEGLKD